MLFVKTPLGIPYMYVVKLIENVPILQRAHAVHHVFNCMSYHGAIGGLAITGRTLCIHVNVYNIYIYIYIYICMYIDIDTDIDKDR